MQDIQTTKKPASALGVMASKLSVEPNKLLDTLKATVFKGASNEELLALVVVANTYDLNPMLRQMYAFPGKNGGIVPVVSIDGWSTIVNRQESFDGVDFAWAFDEETKKPVSCTCTMHIRQRTRPVVVTEFLDECFRNTEPWKTMPKRMLRHKAFIQCARIAFGLSGIYDEDEGKDQADVGNIIPTGGSIEVSVLPVAATKDEKELVDAGLAPAPKKREPQDELASIIIEAGYTFDDLKKWGIESGNIPEGDSLGGFDEIQKAVATRLIRAKVGLLEGIAKLKGVG